jgi:hypothetical protein
LGQDVGSPTRLDWIPLRSKATTTLSPCREVPSYLGFARSTFLGIISRIPLVKWLQYGPRTDSNQRIKDSLAAGQGHNLGFMLNPVAPSFQTRWHQFRYKVVCPVGACAQENSIAHFCGREMLLRPICICLHHRSNV